MASTVPLFIGLLGVGLLPDESKYLWSKWGLYLMSVTGNINGLRKLFYSVLEQDADVKYNCCSHFI